MTSERSICISWSMLPFCYETLAEAIHTAIQPEFRVPTDLFISYACNHSKKICSFLFFSGWPFDQKLGSSLIYFFLCARNHLTKIYDPLSFILSFEHNHSTKMYDLFPFIVSFAHDHSTKNQGRHWFFSLYVHGHSTKS